MHELEEIRAWIHAHRDFRECIVDAIDISDFGTTVALSIDYIWNSDGSVRPDSEERLMVELCLYGVQQLRMENHLNSTMLEDLSAINWGFAEASRIEVIPSTDATMQDVDSNSDFHRLIVHRESGAWIDVEFREMKGGERREPPPPR